MLVAEARTSIQSYFRLVDFRLLVGFLDPVEHSGVVHLLSCARTSGDDQNVDWRATVESIGRVDGQAIHR